MLWRSSYKAASLTLVSAVKEDMRQVFGLDEASDSVSYIANGGGMAWFLGGKAELCASGVVNCTQSHSSQIGLTYITISRVKSCCVSSIERAIWASTPSSFRPGMHWETFLQDCMHQESWYPHRQRPLSVGEPGRRIGCWASYQQSAAMRSLTGVSGTSS